MLHNRIQRLEIEKFRHKFVGHIWDNDRGRPLTNSEIEAMVLKIVDGDYDAFSKWCNTPDGNIFPETVVSIIERTRNRIREEFELSDSELSLNAK